MTQDPEKSIKLSHTQYTHRQPEIPTLGCHSLSTTKPSSILGKPDNLREYSSLHHKVCVSFGCKVDISPFSDLGIPSEIKEY
jgi:hypothetical protein